MRKTFICILILYALPIFPQGMEKDTVAFDAGLITINNYRFSNKKDVTHELSPGIQIVMPEGGNYLIIDISIINTSDSQFKLMMGCDDFIIVDNEGIEYLHQTNFTGVKNLNKFSAVYPGERRRGEFMFQPPLGTNATLYFYPDGCFEKERVVKLKIY